MYTVERLDDIYIIHPISGQQRSPRHKKQPSLSRTIIATLGLALIIFIGIRAAIQTITVDGLSMEPNLHPQELILVETWTYLSHPIARGDVIIFKAPQAAQRPGQTFIKRVIGIPGDVVSIYNGKPVIDGVALKETYIPPQDDGAALTDKPVNNLRIPPDEYFVLGDNRRESFDSRAWGFVPRANIVGRAAFIYWPLQQNNTGFLPNVSSIFDLLHQPPIH